MSLCQTCSSELPPQQLRSAYITPCCDTPICAACIALNPRLKEYSPCLRCGDPRTKELRGSASSSSRGVTRTNDSNRGPTSDGRLGSGTIGGIRAEGRLEQVVFEIGEDEDGAGDGDEEAPPPAYEDRISHSFDQQQQPSAADQVHPEAYHDRQRQTLPARLEHPDNSSALVPASATISGVSAELEAEPHETETVEVRHTLKKGETILAIARKYAADPHELLSLNNLPHTVLSSQPHLLRTRTNLLISRQSVPRSNLLVAKPVSEEEQLADSSEKVMKDEHREKERQVKRFQLVTKTLDPGVGAAYLALEELEESRSGDVGQQPHPLELGSGEALDMNALSTEGVVANGGKKVHLPFKVDMTEGDNREHRALERYWEDEEWERSVGGPPRAASAGGSSGARGSRNTQKNSGGGGSKWTAVVPNLLRWGGSGSGNSNGGGGGGSQGGVAVKG